MDNSNKLESQIIIISIAIFTILCGRVVYGEPKQLSNFDGIRNKITPSHEIWTEYQKLKEAPSPLVQQTNQPLQPVNIDGKRRQFIPAHETWLLYEKLKCDIAAEWVEQKRKEAEAKVAEINYNQLLQAKDKASMENEYQCLAEQFQAISWYKNAAELASECNTQYHKLKDQREKEERQTIRDQLGITDIFKAVQKGTVQDVRYFIEEEGANVNVKNKDDANLTPLHYAAFSNPDVAVMKYLLDKGANVNAKALNDWTPLHVAALNNPSVEVMKCLIGKGGDVKAKINTGKTPFDFATTEEKRAILRNTDGYKVEQRKEIEIAGTWKSVGMGSGTFTFNIDERTGQLERQGLIISEMSYDGERWSFQHGVLSDRKKYFLRKVDANTFTGTVTYSDGKSFPARFERQK